MQISINNLVKEYNGHRVLDVGYLNINKGTILGIIGPNGAGKSTLIKIIGGLEEATSGQVYYNGKKIYSQKDITVVFQKPYLLRTTVFNNVAYPLMIRKEKKKAINNKVNKILKEIGIENLKNQKAWTLSGGEMQKVALARALIFRPSLLILDEPMSNMDPSSIAIMEEMIKKINQIEKTTVIIITHSLQQAKRICKEVVFMHKGKVQEFGSMKEVIFNPKNHITKAFIQGELLIS
ncbi:ATP-binding cassette domain-containing protein [Crassaminicella thermophila]|uniref:ATP-binding cassette domain-containing protein n=1 Tax=Crassaminicella thermophila TaxID=2599308 RepID=A0A5C0SCA2_CRATE|nr:ATP-binding cassette domain-containing protein [Crassaminicella thermophila]QEK11567.1 ATP-binding cassette domain-containing protein [Crassaminicella thermophila]